MARSNASTGRMRKSGGDWEKLWEYCGFCHKRVCVNNYADHKRRVKKLHGKMICIWCQTAFLGGYKNDPTKGFRPYVKIVEKLSDIGCLKDLARNGRPSNRCYDDCSCPSCQSEKLTNG